VLNLNIREMTLPHYLIKSNPNRKVVEDRPMNTPSQKQIMMIGLRADIIISIVKGVDNLEKFIFNSAYPLFSLMMAVLLITFVLTFDPSYLLTHAVFGFTLIFTLQNPEWQVKLMEMPGFRQIFHNRARNKYINPDACKHIKLNSAIKLQKAVKEIMANSIDAETKRLIQMEKAVLTEEAPLKKETVNTNEEFLKLKKKITIKLKSQGVTEELIDQLDEGEEAGAKGDYKIRAKGILEKLNIMREKLAVKIYQLDSVFDAIEKIYFVLTWQNKKASLTLLTLILVGLMVVTFLPLRFFICLGLIKKFARGSSYYKRKYNSNV